MEIFVFLDFPSDDCPISPRSRLKCVGSARPVVSNHHSKRIDQVNKKSEISGQNRDSVRDFVQLLVRHERSLYSYILAQVPNWADADEIAQETRLKLWEQFDHFEPGTNFGAWARKIAHYQILTYRKQQQRKSVRFSEQAIELLSAEAEIRADELSPRHLALEKCLTELTDSHRELIARSYFGQEESTRQIASQLGRTYDATRKTLLRIRHALAHCVDRRLKLEAQS